MPVPIRERTRNVHTKPASNYKPMAILFFLAVVMLIWAGISLEEDGARQTPEKSLVHPAKARHVNDLFFNWRSAKRVAEVFFPAYRYAVDGDFAFFKAVAGPIAGHPHLVLEFYQSLGQVRRSRLAVLLRAVYSWYERSARRSMRDWSLEDRVFPNLDAFFDELVAFLFAAHPVPPFVARVWWYWDLPEWQAFILQTGPEWHKFRHHRPTRALDWDEFIHTMMPRYQGGNPGNTGLQFYFYLAGGGNPAKAPFLNWELGRGAVRHFLETPPGWDPHAAFWRAILLAERGERLVDAWGKDLPRPTGYHDTAFWRNFYRLLMLETELYASGTVRLAMDRIAWLRDGAGPAEWDARFAQLRGAAPAFSFKGRTWRSLLRYLDNLFRLSFRPPAGMAERYSWLARDGEGYIIVLLDTPQAMQNEGAAMGHCLGDDDHLDMAMNNARSFWSLRRLRANGEIERIATITIQDGSIIEMAGAHNAPLDAAMETMLERWMEAVGMGESAM